MEFWSGESGNGGLKHYVAYVGVVLVLMLVILLLLARLV